jgi:hypothetical protein
MADEPADVPVVQPPPRPAAQPFSFGLNGDHFVIGPNELLVNGKSAFVELSPLDQAKALALMHKTFANLRRP